MSCPSGWMSGLSVSAVANQSRSRPCTSRDTMRLRSTAEASARLNALRLASARFAGSSPSNGYDARNSARTFRGVHGLDLGAFAAKWFDRLAMLDKRRAYCGLEDA